MSRSFFTHDPELVALRLRGEQAKTKARDLVLRVDLALEELRRALIRARAHQWKPTNAGWNFFADPDSPPEADNCP